MHSAPRKQPTVHEINQLICSVAQALNYDPRNTAELCSVAYLIAGNGILCTQVPHISLVSNPAGGFDVVDAHSDTLINQMFTDGLLVWKTNQGPVHDREGRSPLSGRILRSRFLFMTAKCVRKHAEALYRVYQASPRRAGPMSRSTFETQLASNAIA